MTTATREKRSPKTQDELPGVPENVDVILDRCRNSGDLPETIAACRKYLVDYMDRFNSAVDKPPSIEWYAPYGYGFCKGWEACKAVFETELRQLGLIGPVKRPHELPAKRTLAVASTRPAQSIA